jgi:hypothetical protein
MIPKLVEAFGKLIGDEYYCCPICFEPKFTVKGRKAVKRDKLGKGLPPEEEASRPQYSSKAEWTREERNAYNTDVLRKAECTAGRSERSFLIFWFLHAALG